MTSRELFIKTLTAEQNIFERVFKAINQKKGHYKHDPKSRTGLELAVMMASEPAMMVALLKKGVLDMGKAGGKKLKSTVEIIKAFNFSFGQVIKLAQATSEKEWEKGEAKMKYEGGEWKSTKGDMLWGFLLDLIHHRGQLSTYLRPMGGKVPSIYGPSADSHH